MALEKFIPIKEEIIAPVAPAPEDAYASTGCEKREPYALMVMGNSMEPEFCDRDIIIIEPDYPAFDGAYVIAWHDGEFIFRQLLIKGEEWIIHPLNSAYPDQTLSEREAVKGVISQKKSPGGRKNRKNYL